MKREEIGKLDIDYYLKVLRYVQDLQTVENGNQIELDILSKEEGNRRWAALSDIQNLFIYMKRTNVGIEELQEWVKDASSIRKGFEQQKIKTPKLFH